ncbi:endonuclease [Gloeocapsa sp. PCC 73106]|uniref:endonuclease n=1 Tax=Gloeocapsa sp. PCC 73106 TaxID=102232 RepID=UPI0011818DE0|nr:endonuclease [Gloeocapsa sp. PCC 73106]
MRKLLGCLLLGLSLLCLNACTWSGEQVSIVSYNVESDKIEDTDSLLVAQDIKLIKPADLWALSEVKNENDARIFDSVIGSNYSSILGKTGASDRLQIIFNNKRLELIESRELANFGGTRAPLVAQFKLRANNREFLFMVNHFNRVNAEKRNIQAENLRQWTLAQKLPVIAAGDYNLDFSLKNRTGNKAFDILMSDDTFLWLEPLCLSQGNCPNTGTQCNPRYHAILDFILLGGSAKQWQGKSEILFKDQPVCEKESKGYADHYPVAAQIIIN